MKKKHLSTFLDLSDFQLPEINRDETFFLSGSCFAIEMDKYLSYYGFSTILNPFGTLYNTHSLKVMFKRIVDNYNYKEEDLHFDNDKFLSLEHSTIGTHRDKINLLSNLNDTILESHNYLKSTDYIIITLGSSIVYTMENMIVANCHRLKNSLFNQKLLSVTENYHNINEIYTMIRKINKSAKIIFTISPVRHLSYGLSLNMRSKANLKSSLSDFIEATKDEKVFYFPSFEIVMDYLRDYRFYKSDGKHLTSKSIRFIMKQFFKLSNNQYILKTIEDLDKFYKKSSHRIRDVGSDSHLKWLKSLIDDSDLLINKGVMINLPSKKKILFYMIIYFNKEFDIDKYISKFFKQRSVNFNFFKKLSNFMLDLDINSTELEAIIKNDNSLIEIYKDALYKKIISKKN